MNYVKTVWRDLPDRTTPINAARLNNLETQYDKALAQRVDLDVRDFGAFAEASTWQVNRDAMQAANDAATLLPGGATVHLPAGEFTVKGVIQDSRVVFQGHGTVLAHPDGLAPDMIAARIRTTTGTIAANSHTLTVASATGIEVGAVVGVGGAGGYSATQNTLLTAAVDATQTTGFTLASAAGFPTAGYMVIGTEVIQYTGISTATLTGVTRGVWGTTAAAHGTTGPADVIGMASRHIAQVVGVSGTTVTLDRPAPLGVTSASVTFGIVSPGIYDVRIEGNRDAAFGARSVYPIDWSTVGNGHGDNIYVHRGETSVFLGLGSTGCEFGTVTADDCGNPETSSGASFWMFQSCRRNKIHTLRIQTAMWSGLYWDDRTTTAEPFDGPCEDNSVDFVSIDIPLTTALNAMPLTTGVLAISSNRNHVGHLSASGVRTPLVVEAGGQWYTWNSVEPECRGNTVGVYRAKNAYQPWVINANGNTVVDAAYVSFLATGTLAAGSTVLVSAPNGANPAVRFSDGSQSAPSLRFGDAITGFYRITASGEVQYVQGNVLGVRLTGNGIRFTDTSAVQVVTLGATNGTRIGSGATEKLGFYGAAPVVRPAAVADATDAASAITQLNALLARLRTLGLITT